MAVVPLSYGPHIRKGYRQWQKCKVSAITENHSLSIYFVAFQTYSWLCSAANLRLYSIRTDCISASIYPTLTQYCSEMRKVVFVLAHLLYLSAAVAQNSNYPQGYFRNPLAIPIILAGNFGECRPNHFHSGMDIKTLGKENQPVYAVAEGYISRIKMERGGFGHALYITHPNGYTTLYAHLNDFMPDVQAYMKREQYKKESWELDIPLSPNQFPVKKGTQIAWSGNTGASTAPHLHFEIRNTATEHPLNPMLFGFEIKDDIAPIPTQIAIYNMDKSIYEQTPIIVALKKRAGNYVADTIKTANKNIGVALNVNDYMNGSDNTLTFYTAGITIDSVEQGRIRLDDIGYDVTRYLHAYVDYKTRKRTGQWLQLFFQLKGNALNDLYAWKGDKGLLNIADGNVHKLDIDMQDANGNTSNIVAYIQHNQGADSTADVCNSFKALQPNKFEHPNVNLQLDAKALYDDMCFQFSSKADAASLSDRFQLHLPYVPVHTYFDLRIKPNKAIGFAQRDKVALIYSDGTDESGKSAIYEGGWYKASVRNFGNYRLVMDTQPPVIKSLQKQSAVLTKAKRISFTAKDAITSVKKFRVTINGQWLCFEQRGDVFFYNFDEHCPKGKNTMVVTATDENGNTQTLNYTFTR